MELNERLDQFLSSENLTRSQFADSINVARAGISHIMAGRNKPSYEFIVNTIQVYPTLNIEWLLTGNGTMYRDGLSRSPEQNASPGTENDMAQGGFSRKGEGEKISRIVVFFNDGTYKEFY